MLNAMEEHKRDGLNKSKRSKSDQVKQTVLNYLQKRNYPLMQCQNISPKQCLESFVIENEVSRPNSILFSCDPLVDFNFNKFMVWLKESQHKNKNSCDLDYLVGPLFCHLYLEILRGGYTERAASFLKIHMSSVDRSKCDDTVKDLINAFKNETANLSTLREKFRSNKYVIYLSSNSIRTLKKFLAESAHVVLLHLLQNWFSIFEEEDTEVLPETDEMENDDLLDKAEIVLCNGHVNVNIDVYPTMQKLKDSISALRKEFAPTYLVTVSNIKNDVTCGLINRKHDLVLYSSNGSIFARPVQTLTQMKGADVVGELVVRGHSCKIYDLALVKKYRLLVSASHDKTLYLYDLNNFSLRSKYKGHNFPVYCVTCSDNSDFMVSGSYDNTVRLWSTARSDTLKIYAGHTQQVTSIDFHPNSLYFASGSADKCIRLCTVNHVNPVRCFIGSKGTIYSVAFSPSGKYIASAGEDKRLRIWDITGGKQLVEMKTGSEIVNSIVWSGDEKILSTGTIDGSIRYWNWEPIVKNPTDTNFHDPFSFVTLKSKLLNMEHCFDTFACLTAQTSMVSS